jgi:hypothetical protein
MLTEKIIIIQPIFAIDDITFKLQIESLQSTLEYLNKYSTNIPLENLQIIYGGYCCNNTYWKDVLLNIKDIYILRGKKNVSVYKLDENYGKAYIVNNLYNSYADKNVKWLLTYDSDIKYSITEENIFERCVNTALLIDNSKINTALLNSKVVSQFGLFALNQLEDSCHLGFEDGGDKNIQYVDNEIIEWHSSGDGIAGGIFFINTEAWKKINGYRCTAIYGGDDGHCIGDMQRHGYTVTLAKSINMIHPKKINVNWNYENWKRESLISNDSIYGIIIDEDILNYKIYKYKEKVESHLIL